jgi:hypothetical protein
MVRIRSISRPVLRPVHQDLGHHGAGPGEFDQPHDISIGGSPACESLT